MGLTAFNRARRLAAERLAQQQAKAPTQEQSEKSATNPDPIADSEEAESDSKSETILSREQREAQLKALNWEALKELLGSYELPINKPKGVSWDDFAIPQILEYEGF